MTDDPVERAKADRIDVARQINRLDAEIARIAHQRDRQVIERDRLTAFIELYAKYTAPAELTLESDPEEPQAVPEAPAPQVSEETTAKTAPKKSKRRKGIAHKPKSAPSMPDMIRAALTDARARGVQSLDSRGMRAYIASKWWSSVTVARIRPVAWRMSTVGELQKVADGVYSLPESEPPAKPKIVWEA